MKKTTLQIIFASILPLLFFINVLIPPYVLGCRTRGLIAVIVALISALIGLFAVVKAIIIKEKSLDESISWIIRSLILAVPAIYIVLTAY